MFGMVHIWHWSCCWFWGFNRAWLFLSLLCKGPICRVKALLLLHVHQAQQCSNKVLVRIVAALADTSSAG